MSQAQAGHGTLIAVELTPGGAFTTIAELNADINYPTLSRGEAEATPHNDTIDTYRLGVIKREPFSFGVNHLFANQTHDSTTGLLKMMLDGLERGWRIRGPGITNSTDEWIISGAVQSISQVAPVREGIRTSEVTVRASGKMMINGTEYGVTT